MADPLSITGLILAVGSAINALISISVDARDAPTDIQKLRKELLVGLLALNGALQHFQNQTQSSQWSSQQFIEMLQTACHTIEMLKRDVEKPQSRLARSTQRLTWHWKKEDLAKHLTQIERVKTWFLLAMTTDRLSSNYEVLQQIQSLKLSIEQGQGSRTAEPREVKHKQLLQYLAPIGPETTHSKALSDHQQGTSDWFTDGPLQQFLNISDRQGAILWLKGKSGSGKTTLLAHAIEYLRTQRQVARVLPFYCSFDNSNLQNLSNILGSFISQLSFEVPAILEELMTKAEAGKRKGQEPNFSATELEKVFIKHIPAKCKTYLIVDAINESEISTELEALCYRLTASCLNLRIIISSTSDWSLNTDPCVIRFGAQMNSHDVDKDIRVYVDRRLKHDRTLGMLSESLKEEVRNNVLSKSNGMFRYAQCEMDHLASQRTGRGVRRALSGMSSNLNETYERTLKNIRTTEDRRLIKRSLLWLAYSLRPLKLQELVDAVVVEEEDDTIDDDIRLHDPMILLEYANGLFEFDPVTQAVSLSHSSIKTFLTSDWIKNSSVSYFAFDGETECHLKIMRWCLTYLSFSEFNSGCGAISESTMSRYPLLGYAAWNWPYHLRNPSAKDWRVVSAFLSTRRSDSGGNYGCWIHVLNQIIHPEIVKETQPLYYAASFGFSPLVEAMLLFDDSLDLEAPGGSAGSTALQVACFRRQKKVSQMLVEAGADFLSRDGSFPDGRGLTSLWWAETNGWVDVVALMTSIMAQKQIRPAPEDTHPINFIQEVQKADARERMHIMEGRQTELLDNPLVATEIPRYHLSKSKMERFLEERFGKGNFVIDVLQDYYLVTAYEELSRDDWRQIRQLSQ